MIPQILRHFRTHKKAKNNKGVISGPASNSYGPIPFDTGNKTFTDGEGVPNFLTELTARLKSAGTVKIVSGQGECDSSGVNADEAWFSSPIDMLDINTKWKLEWDWTVNVLPTGNQADSMVTGSERVTGGLGAEPSDETVGISLLATNVTMAFRYRNTFGNLTQIASFPNGFIIGVKYPCSIEKKITQYIYSFDVGNFGGKFQTLPLDIVLVQQFAAELPFFGAPFNVIKPKSTFDNIRFTSIA